MSTTICHSASGVSVTGPPSSCGAADQDIEPAERIVSSLCYRLNLCLVGDVAMLIDRFSAGGRDEPSGLLGGFGIDIDAGDRGARLGKGDRDCSADASARAAY